MSSSRAQTTRVSSAPLSAENLHATCEAWAAGLQSRLESILVSPDLGLRCEATESRNGQARISVSNTAANGIVLSIQDEPRLQLEIDYELVLGEKSRMPTVHSSSFTLRPFAQRRPLLTLDYEREARSNTPAAHYNFHFEHDRIIDELLRTGAGRRGAIHRRTVRRGGTPRLAELHFPLGGHRFRPCLEDLIEHIWVEFGIDVHTQTARAAIRQGRREWRARQLKAAVADDPASAVEELRRHGYWVLRPFWSKATTATRDDRIEAY